MKKALITGQDGSYLAELLLEKGYEVHGMVRRDEVRNLVVQLCVQMSVDELEYSGDVDA